MTRSDVRANIVCFILINYGIHIRRHGNAWANDRSDTIHLSARWFGESTENTFSAINGIQLDQ